MKFNNKWKVNLNAEMKTSIPLVTFVLTKNSTFKEPDVNDFK